MTYNFRNDKKTETDYGILFSVMERMYGNGEKLFTMELRMRGFSEIRLLNNSFIRTDQILKIENFYDKVTGEPIKEKKSFLKAIANSITNR